MNVTIEKLPECRAKILAAVPVNTVTDIRKSVLAEFMAKAKIPGFRPGKLPAKLIEQKFAVNIEKELRNCLGREILKEAVDNQKLGFIGFVSIDRAEFESDGTYTFNCEVVVKPEFEITEADYKNIPVTVTIQRVTDEMIEQWLGGIQEKFATFISTDEPADFLDKVMVSYVAHRDGNPLEEQIKPELILIARRDLEFEVPIPKTPNVEYEMIPGLAAGLVGMRAGESREIQVSFGENFMVPELRETQATYTVKVHSVQKANLPPIDDELAKKLGSSDLESVKNSFKELMEMRFFEDRIKEIDNQVITHLNKEYPFELPKEQLYQETKMQVEQIVSQIARSGLKPDEYKKQIIESATSKADLTLRARYILIEVSKKENIPVTEQEIYEQLVAIAQSEGRSVKKVARKLEEDTLEAIKNNIIIGKTIAFLRAHASITEVEETTSQAT
jgi:trigger factor